ncbi:MBL fold metallo-hydrolase [Hamadaea tsunoensis]|uniref:MBL fold metallo-hydrolase n=1 Tax=Hamadaea tsunoensis TaxID=53368 RepID=UPI00041228B5|nr:MBL fold metallo-hydrolase [Hamadaea tsunoensis]
MQSNSTPPNPLRRREVLRRTVLGGTAAAVGLAAAPVVSGAAPAAAARPRGTADVTFRWLGVAGWQVVHDGHVLYFDPYLSRFDYQSNPALDIDPTIVDRLLAAGTLAGPPELIMVSHGHWDHLADVPQLLARPDWAGATIRTIGTDTVRNLLAGMGVSDARRKNFIVATGGEELDFGAYQVRVVRSLHSQSKGFGFAMPGVRVAPPPTPQTISDLVEGGTLAYQVTFGGRLRVLFSGGTNFVERELEGLRPDVVMVSMTDYSSLPDYLERLLTVLGGPRYVVPVHHDDMVTKFDNPNLPGTVDATAATRLRDAIRALRMPTKVIEARHLEAFTL